MSGHARGVFRDLAPELPVPPSRIRERLKSVSRTEEAHRAAMIALPCMTMLEFRPTAPKEVSFPFVVGAWNLERCLSPEASAEVLTQEGVSVALLSELDAGMARTGQRNTTAALARCLGAASAYAVEFLELDMGNPVELTFCVDDRNLCGFHGNALLAPALARPFLVRLDDHGHWFAPESPEARIGGRCAVGGWIETPAGPILAVSAHLESDATPDERGVAFSFLLDAVEDEAAGRPIILGGDLNTGLKAEGNWRVERSLSEAEARGFARHSGAEEATTTRPSRITRHPSRAYKLDWILTRGVAVGASRIVPALDPEGTPLSDHDLVTLEVLGIA